MHSIKYALAIAALAVPFLNSQIHAQGWGDVKGQVVWTGGAIPGREKINPNKDQQHCLSRGDLISTALLIDDKTKGVKNVMVWLAPVNAGGALPIHPTLQAVPKEKVVIDQPCCQFEPRITMMREG